MPQVAGRYAALLCLEPRSKLGGWAVANVPEKRAKKGQKNVAKFEILRMRVDSCFLPPSMRDSFTVTNLGLSTSNEATNHAQKWPENR